MFGMEFYVDPSRCIGCQSCVKACEECDTHRGVSMINFDFIDRPETIATAAYVCMHCDDPTCAQVCPADAIKKGEDGIVELRAQAALHRLLQLRAGLPVRHSEAGAAVRADDEVRHVLRPDVRRQEARCAPRSVPARRLTYVTPETIAATRREKPVNSFWFGNQRITTKVYMMAPANTGEIAIDVADYTWEGER